MASEVKPEVTYRCKLVRVERDSGSWIEAHDLNLNSHSQIVAGCMAVDGSQEALRSARRTVTDRAHGHDYEITGDLTGIR